MGLFARLTGQRRTPQAPVALRRRDKRLASLRSAGWLAVENLESRVFLSATVAPGSSDTDGNIPLGYTPAPMATGHSTAATGGQTTGGSTSIGGTSTGASTPTTHLTITPTFDSSITSDPNAATIEATINSAIQVYENDFSDPITVSIYFQEGGGLGGSSTYYGSISYSQYRAAVVSHATTAFDNAAIASLPNTTTNPVNGNASIDVTTANLRALGFSASPPSYDSTITLNTSICNLSRTSTNSSNYDLLAVASHEIDEALGFGSALNGLSNGAATPTGAVYGLDLYRYGSGSTRSFDTGSSTAAFFSYNGGSTDLTRFNQHAGGDFSDWYSYGVPHTPQVQDAYATPGAFINLNAELTGLDVLGYTPIIASPTIVNQPASVSVAPASQATFAVLPSGVPASTIQWQVSTNGGASYAPISGATGTNYSFTASASQNGNLYEAVLTSSQGSLASAPATLTVTSPLSAPVVTQQPQNQSVTAGATATFTATASGNPAPTVQWQVSTNGGSSYSPISGATSTTYSFTAATSQNGYLYEAVFTNSQGSVASSAASLAVAAAPSVGLTVNSATITSSSTSPVSGYFDVVFNVPSGVNDSLAGYSTEVDVTPTSGGVTLTGVGAPANYVFGAQTPSVVSGANSDAMVVHDSLPGSNQANAISNGQGMVRVDFQAAAGVTGSFSVALSHLTLTDGSGNAIATGTINPGTITVSAPALVAPAITTQPMNQSVNAGATATFTAAASGNPTPTVQWQVSTDGGSTYSPISGATSTTYSFTATAAQNNALYEAVFTNSQGSATTNAATLSVASAATAVGLTVNSVKVVSNASSAVSGYFDIVFNVPSGVNDSLGGYTVEVDASPTNSGLVFTGAATPANYVFGTQTPTVLSGANTTSMAVTDYLPGANQANPITDGEGMARIQFQAQPNVNASFTVTLSNLTLSDGQGNALPTGTINPGTITVSPFIAPAVSTQPQSQSVTAGSTATFSAAATGNPTPTVQWQVSTNGGTTYAPISGATLTSYSFTAAQSQNGNLYEAVFTNSQGSVTTSAATLTVSPAPALPTVTAQPQSASVAAGTQASFSAAATGYPAPTVQWELSTNGGSSFTAISGATSTTYSFTTAASQNGYEYEALFTNSVGSTASNPAVLTVLSAPTITTQPASQSIAAGGSVSLVAAASGNPTPTVQWQVSTNGGTSYSPIAGATSATYSFSATAAQNGNLFEAVFSNSQGSATTAAATLTVLTAPAVTTQPVSQSIGVGKQVTFSAAASGNPTPTVQWQVSSNGGATYSAISGATSASYSFTAAASQNGNLYEAVFTNSQGSATTAAATLNVLTAPTITTQPLSQSIAAAATATFTAAATGNPTPTVQWQVSTNGGATYAAISGATSTTYSFTTTANQSGNLYQAVFTNSQGSATTAAATLTVLTAPTITTQPASQTVVAGAIATFSAAASATPSPTVQWQVSTNGGATYAPISGATSATYSFTAAANQGGWLYEAVFSNSQGSATTSAASLTVQSAPAIVSQPVNQSVAAGATATFSAAASATPTPTVQWQVSTNGGLSYAPISGATSTTYSFTATAAQNGYLYEAVFTNSVGSATTSPATLSVQLVPTITTQPTSQTVSATATATFTAAASGTPTPTVQWQVSSNGGVSFSNVSGATSGTLTVAGGVDGNLYQAVFTNSSGSVVSRSAGLTVLSAPVLTAQPAAQTAPAGTPVTFTALAQANPAPTVQWQISTDSGSTYSAISGATSSAYATTAVASHNGALYRAVFTNSQGSATSNAVTLTVTAALAAPTVTANPASTTATAGKTASFSAAATGTPTPAVQWWVSTNGGASWGIITGATSTTYSSMASLAKNNYLYRASFSNSAGSTLTLDALLTVTSAAPAVTTSPASQTLAVGNTAYFHAVASGTPAPTVQWQLSTNGGSSWTNISGATSAGYGFTVASTENGYRYRALFTNAGGSVASASATLTVSSAAAAPAIVAQPLPQSVNAGATASFVATASGSPNPTVQWQQSTNSGTSWSNISGATATTYSFAASTSRNGYEYRAVFTSASGSATSAAARLSVAALAAPLVTTQPPASVSIDSGSVVELTSAASGNPAATVQWQLSTDGGASYSNISGATATTYCFRAATSGSGDKYRAVFTNSSGSATSSAATVSVTAAQSAPLVTTQPLLKVVASGASVTFTAAATGFPTPTVQWQVSSNGGSTWTSLSGATATSYTLTASAANSGLLYRASFSNARGTTYTNPALLTVNAAPAITLQPVSQSVAHGTAVTFKATASGSPTPAIQWQLSADGGATWTDIAGATASSYLFTAVLSQSGYDYRALFTNSAGSIASGVATLTVS